MISQKGSIRLLNLINIENKLKTNSSNIEIKWKVYLIGDPKRDIRQGYLVLRWDARREEKGKHGKFENP